MRLRIKMIRSAIRQERRAKGWNIPTWKVLKRAHARVMGQHVCPNGKGYL